MSNDELFGTGQHTFPVDPPEASIRVAGFDGLPQEAHFRPVILLKSVHWLEPSVQRVLGELTLRMVGAQQGLSERHEVGQRGELSTRRIHRVQEIIVLGCP